MPEYRSAFKKSFRMPFEDRYYIQVWEYRGHEYEVTIAKSWTGCSSDYLRGGYMSQYNQHKRAHEDIDNMIDNPEPVKEPVKQKYEGSAQEGFDKLWAYINGDETAFN